MGHYASEMRSDSDQREIDDRDSKVRRVLKLGFTTAYDDRWNCGDCGALVQTIDMAFLHHKWHQSTGTLA